MRLTLREGEGIALQAPGESLELRFGQLEERLACAPGQRPGRVRDLLREQGVPPWLRRHYPLVYRGSALLAVGHRVAQSAQADCGQTGALPEIRWGTEIL